MISAEERKNASTFVSFKLEAIAVSGNALAMKMSSAENALYFSKPAIAKASTAWPLFHFARKKWGERTKE